MKAIQEFARNIAYQYTALQMVLNNDYWTTDAEEDDFDDMAFAVILSLSNMGLMDEFMI